MSRVRSCLLAALFVVVGVVLSPLRAAAATIPTLFAYDGMVRPTTTTALGGQDAVRPAEPPSISAYEAAPFGYDDRPNVRVAARVGVVRAYDGGLNLDERSELAKGVIYDARTVTKAAEGVEGIALREGQAAASGMQAHHIFPQAAEFAESFEQGGVSIEEFRVQLSEGTHLGQLHGSGGVPGVGPGGLWNETWRQYFAGEAAAGRAITQEGPMQQAGQMLGDFGVPYYSPLPGF